ncbi:MND1-interacting protein 1-like [Coffea arabica]|uniref:MND1-interacting protein 1-like n=1 Tax=Coffea arabica TaxID=13443 RepID=A0A6P6U4X5_COFAR
MGCTVRDKHIRTNRRARSVKPETDHHSTNAPTNTPNSSTINHMAISKSIMETGLRPLNYQMGTSDSVQNPNLSTGPNSVFDDSGWGYCTEEQLEDILLKNLEILYNDAISKLVALGYDEEVALKAILRNGHCYGGMDVLTNILHNSLAYLNSGCCLSNGNSEESEAVFGDLRQLEEYSLAGMVCLLQQIKPHLSRGDAMWCLLMSDLHVGRASVMEIPVLPSPNGNGACASGSVNSGNVEALGNGPVGVAPALCRFHSGWGFGNGGTSEFPMNGFFSYASEMALQKEIECPKRFNLTPSMKTLLKRNVAMFAAGFRANARQFHSQLQTCPSSASSGDSSVANGTKAESAPVGQNEENVKNQDVVNSVLNKFRHLNLDENIERVPMDQKDEMILSLIHQIKALEEQVKERKEWAHQKAMQAARKLSHDLTELKMLRMEREETQRLKKGKQNLEDTTMKRLTEMENSLRKASGQVDRANAAVRKLETENAEIRAEMEASKLSASESVTSCLEAAKREKKCLKRLLAWEKQKAKLQEDIAAEKQKVSDIKQQLTQVETAQNEAEAKWRQEQNDKEVALAQVEDERRLKEATESNSKRRLEALRLKSEIDFQRHKDDLQRLEQELARLKASQRSNELQHPSTDQLTGNSEVTKPQAEGIVRLLHELDNLDNASEKETNYNRECVICMKDEVSVVFLPCAHQVLCVKCNEGYGKKGKATCPCCRVPIEQRVRVFGAAS